MSHPPRAWQRMLSGRPVQLLDQTPMDIEVGFIAHGLAFVARWNGQTRGDFAYSVAEHSLLVETLFRRIVPKAPVKWQLAALLHDAPEYVIGDMISPVKAAVGPGYGTLDDRLAQGDEIDPEERALMQARRSAEPKLFSMATGLMHFAFLQILLGALVAGIDAGRSYNDWPLMGGEVFPSNAFDFEPLWRNFFENAGLVQFMHRVSGYLLFVFGVVVWLRARRSANRDTRFRFNAVFAVLFLQVVLGIVTVVYAAPWHIAIVHQLGAVALLALILRARFAARYPAPQSIRGTS